MSQDYFYYIPLHINEGEEPVGFKDAITEFEKNISDDDDENANENLEERQLRKLIGRIKNIRIKFTMEK